MSARDYNAMMNNPESRDYFVEQQILLHAQYCKDNPDSLLPLFSQELWKLGFHFAIPDQVHGFLPKHKKVIIPVVIRYYQHAKMIRKENEQNFFLGFFHMKGLDQVLPMLLEDYYNEKTADLTRWFISDAIYSIRSKKYIKEYIDIAKTVRFGSNRKLIVLLLGKLKEESAIPILIDLLEDDEVRLHAICALGDFKREEFRPYFERFQNSEHPVWRKYSRAALKKLK